MRFASLLSMACAPQDDNIISVGFVGYLASFKKKVVASEQD